MLNDLNSDLRRTLIALVVLISTSVSLSPALAICGAGARLPPMIRVVRIIGRTLVYAAIAVGMPALTLGITLLIQLMTDSAYCVPSNWAVC